MSYVLHDDSRFWADHLSEDEKLVWQGRPLGTVDLDNTALRFAQPAAFACVFIFLVLNLSKFGVLPFEIHPNIGAEIYAGTVAVIAYLAVYIWRNSDFINEKNTKYALTNKRALIATGRWRPKVHSKYMTPLTPLEWDYQDPGTIFFDDEMKNYGAAPFHGTPTIKTRKLGFQNIEQSQYVHGLMQKAMNGQI